MNITAEGLKKKTHSKEDFILLDIREKYEVDFAKIPGSIHIPMRELPANLDKLDKSKEIVVYCHTGGRSSYMVSYLKSKGYNALNLLGGIDGYSEKIDKKIKQY